MKGLFESRQIAPSLFQSDFMDRPFVQQSVPAPWFYISVSVLNVRDSTAVMYMLPSFDALEDVLKYQGKNYVVESIQYVTPAFMNESGEWKMENLLEISEVVDGYGAHAKAFNVDGGRTYLGFDLVDGASFKPLRIIFKRAAKGGI